MKRPDVKVFVSDIFQEKAYLIYSDGNAIVIDPGNCYNSIIKFVKNKHLNVLAVLFTHGHFDHCMSCKSFQENGVLVYIHSLDADKLYTDGNLANMFGIHFDKLFANRTIEEGELCIGNFELLILHTPGHSAGSVCYIIDNYLFSGDIIFENGIGRTDFYDGDYKQLMQSIQKIKPYLDNGYKLFPGH